MVRRERARRGGPGARTRPGVEDVAGSWNGEQRDNGVARRETRARRLATGPKVAFDRALTGCTRRDRVEAAKDSANRAALGQRLLADAVAGACTSPAGERLRGLGSQSHGLVLQDCFAAVGLSHAALDPGGAARDAPGSGDDDVEVDVGGPEVRGRRRLCIEIERAARDLADARPAPSAERRVPYAARGQRDEGALLEPRRAPSSA